jgi:hypothetical protein
MNASTTATGSHGMAKAFIAAAVLGALTGPLIGITGAEIVIGVLLTLVAIAYMCMGRVSAAVWLAFGVGAGLSGMVGNTAGIVLFAIVLVPSLYIVYRVRKSKNVKPPATASEPVQPATVPSPPVKADDGPRDYTLDG